MITTAALTENSRQGIKPEKQPCIKPEAWLSPNPRWGCGHAYDETPVGIVVYVRNDPVNKIDPDGRNAASFMCSAQYSYGQCGGDALFWGGIDSGFGNDYGERLAAGWLPGMPAAMWAALLKYNFAVEDAFERNGDNEDTEGANTSAGLSRPLSQKCISQFSRFIDWNFEMEGKGTLESLTQAMSLFKIGLTNAYNYTISEISDSGYLSHVHWYSQNTIELDTNNIISAKFQNAESVVHEITHVGFYKSHFLYGLFARSDESKMEDVEARFRNYISSTHEKPCDPFKADR